MSRPFFELAAFLLGLLFGSFLNVCISRLPHHRSIAKPSSHCPKCLTPIHPYDNIPLLSWLLLRARCRSCKTPISFRYPLVELATGLWFLLIVFLSAANPLSFSGIASLALAVLGFLLIGLIIMDWQTQRLPDAFTLTGIAIALFLICTQAIFLGPNEADVTLSATHQLRMSSPGSMASQGNVFLTGPEHLIFGRLLAISAVTLLLLAIRFIYKALRHRDGLGLGDVKMLAMVAAFLGLWPAILTLFLGTLLATLYALPLVLRGKANALTKLPFGSFLGVAGLVAALAGEPIIAWYTHLLQ